MGKTYDKAHGARAEKRWKQPTFIYGLLIVGGLLALTLYLPFPGSSAVAADITVYKSPSCGCCQKWAAHLKKAGFSVAVENRQDMPSVKRSFGVRPQHQSCHTAITGGYVIEGHVPSADIALLLKTRPSVSGLFVPGMPVGAPGMKGRSNDSYAVLAVDRHGNEQIFARH